MILSYFVEVSYTDLYMNQYVDSLNLNRPTIMLKQAATVAGAALILSPIGIPLASCGLPGLLVAGAGLFVADAFLKDMKGAMNKAEAGGEEASGDEGEPND